MSRASWRGDLSALLRWIADEPDGPDIELVCAEHGDASRGSVNVAVVRVPGCLASVSAVSYLELIAAGAPHVTVRVDGCRQVEQVRQAASEAGQFLEASGRAAALTCSAESTGRRSRVELDLRKLPLSRRRLLRFAVPKAAQLPVTTAPERERLLAVLQRLRPPEAGGRPALAELAAPSADLVATGCNGCGVCVRSCAAGAIRQEWPNQEQGSVVHLLFSARACTDCQRCVSLCPVGALSRRSAASWGQLLDERTPRLLAVTHLKRCVRCHAMFRADDDQERCPTCTFRAANPFGSHLAPDAVST